MLHRFINYMTGNNQNNDEENPLRSATLPSSYLSIPPESPEIKEVKQLPRTSRHILAELKEIVNETDRRGKIAHCCEKTRVVYLGFIGFLLTYYGFIRSMGQTHDNVDQQIQIAQDSYHNYPCPTDRATFSSLPELCYRDQQTAAKICVQYPPDLYCFGEDNHKQIFENSHVLSDDCYQLLTTYCENELALLDTASDRDVNNAIFYIVLGLLVTAGIYVISRIQNQSLVRINVSQAELHSDLMERGILPLDEKAVGYAEMRTFIQQDIDIIQNAEEREEELMVLQTELMKLRIVPEALIPQICSYALTLYEVELQKMLAAFPLRCEKYQIPFTHSAANRQNKANTGEMRAGAMKRYQFLNDPQSAEPRNHKYPAKVLNTIYDYLDSEECGVVTMPFSLEAGENKLAPETRGECSSGLSLEENITRKNIPTLTTDQYTEIKARIDKNITQNAVYVRLTDNNNHSYLFYFNRARDELRHFMLTEAQMNHFDMITEPSSSVQMLSLEVLENIKQYFHHDHFVSARSDERASSSMRRSA